MTLLHTLPVEFENKIIVPSRQIVVRNELEHTAVGEAIRVDDFPYSMPSIHHDYWLPDGRQFRKVRGTIELNDKLLVVQVWERIK